MTSNSTLVQLGEHIDRIFMGHGQLTRTEPLPQPVSALTYHKDVWMPSDVTMPLPGMPVFYSHHALFQANVKNIQKLPTHLQMPFTVIEASTTEEGAIVKWVLRQPYDEHRDLVMAVKANGLVKTVWLNARADQHVTLRRGAYQGRA